MRLLPLLLPLFGLAACDPASATVPAAHLTGRVDRSTFPLTPPPRIEALGDDGAEVHSDIHEDGTFELELPLENVWGLRLSDEKGVGYAIALARLGHFDRGLSAEGRAEARLGVLWLPPASTPDVRRVLERDAASCPEGRLEDGTPCAVLESLVSCADGPQRPTDDPSSLLLGTGSLQDLPGVSSGVRYVIASWVPAPILWECPAAAPP